MISGDRENLNRRDFLAAAAGGVAGSLLAGCGLPDSGFNGKSGSRYNVLFIAVDDLRPELGCYGAKQIISPNIDKLAAQGMMFDRHYVQQGVCIPSRVSMFTGVRPDTTRQMFGELIFRQTCPEIRTMAEHFHEHGYYTAHRGKIIHGFYDIGRFRYGLDEPVVDPDWNDMYVEEENKALLPLESGRCPVTECSDKSDALHLDGKIIEEALVTLNNCASSGKPFFLGVGFHKPHLPFSAPKRFWDLYKRDEIQLADNPYLPKNMPLQAFNAWADMSLYRETASARKLWEAVRDGTEFPDISDDTAREFIHGYYACVSWTDYNIGRLIDEMERLQLRDNTIIVLWGDHGWHLGENRMWSKSDNFEISTRSPLLVCVPGQKTAGQRTKALVESVDVFPTLNELCGLPQPALAEGCSFVPLLDRPGQEWKKAAFSQYDRGKYPDVVTMGYSMRTDRYRYTEWARGWTVERPTSWEDYEIVARELYDHQNDPQENINIVDEPGNGPLAAQLSRQLRAGWREAGPPGWRPYAHPAGFRPRNWRPRTDMWTDTDFTNGSLIPWFAVPATTRLALTADEQRNGEFSLKVSGRADTWHTAKQEVRFEDDKEYDFSVWVKLAEGRADATLVVAYIDEKDEQHFIDIAAEKVNAERWTAIRGLRVFDEGCPINRATLYLQVSDRNVDYYLDDFYITVKD